MSSIFRFQAVTPLSKSDIMLIAHFDFFIVMASLTFIPDSAIS